MIDLVTQLRSRNCCTGRGGCRCDEAADEIERLRKALDNERARGIHTCHDNCQRPLCVSGREIDRLRSLLREAAETIVALRDGVHSDGQAIMRPDLYVAARLARARAALQPENDDGQLQAGGDAP
jgi:hypothetical protein